MNLSTDQRAYLFYTLAQVYSVIGNSDNDLVNHYYDLAEAETQKPDFAETRIKGNILFGRTNLFIPFTDSELFDIQELQPSQADSLRKAAAMTEESMNYMQSCMQYVTLSLLYSLLAEMNQSRQYIQKALETVSGNSEWSGAVSYVCADGIAAADGATFPVLPSKEKNPS